VRDIVVVGASLAGLRAAESLRRHGHDGTITIVGAEPHEPYDRPPLSKQVLAGTKEAGDVFLGVDPALEAELALSTRAEALDINRRRLTLRGGDELHFDGLVLATGARPRTLPGLSGSHLEGVHLLRTIDDCLRLRAELDGGPRVTVVGAGFIGSEVASTCHRRGLDVTVIEALPVPLERAVGPEMGAVCGRLHTDNGVRLLLGVGVVGLRGSRRVEEVVLENGSSVPADVVVIGVGVAPETDWLAGSGLDLSDGVVCDAWCRALSSGRPVEGVVAAGDVSRWDHPAFGGHIRVEHWTNAVEQGDHAAAVLLAGEEAGRFAPVPYFWSDQYGTKIQFVGRAVPGDEMTVVEGAVGERRWVAAYGHEGRLTAALSFNWPVRIMAYRRMIEEGAEYPPPPAVFPTAPAHEGTER
jgi:3-phenylpropionate/trans-cinnamate dioxygenase ferredoxin reductase subunit